MAICQLCPSGRVVDWGLVIMSSWVHISAVPTSTQLNSWGVNGHTTQTLHENKKVTMAYVIRSVYCLIWQRRCRRAITSQKSAQMCSIFFITRWTRRTQSCNKHHTNAWNGWVCCCVKSISNWAGMSGNWDWFLTDCTNGCAYATVLRLSVDDVVVVVCDVMYCG